MLSLVQQRNLAVVLFVLVLLSGCGGVATYPVTGFVTINGEGPLTVGEIVFTSDEGTSKGTIQKDGSFKLKTTIDKELEGAPAGKYKVFIIGAATYEDSTRLDSPSKMLIDSKYNDYRTSGLEFTVEPGDNNFEIEVTKPKA